MTAADRLRATLVHAEPRLLALANPATRPATEAWSPQEVVGHLVDSAVNNVARIVRGALGAPLVFEGYDQDAWVEAGRYATADWPALVGLWRGLNEQIARTVDGIAPEALDRPHAEHSLDRIAWRVVPPDEPVTLRYIVDDYVGHLRHHLAAIDPALVD
ncbi:MAG: DinB family protein [Bacteroidota bacterium]